MLPSLRIFAKDKWTMKFLSKKNRNFLSWILNNYETQKLTPIFFSNNIEKYWTIVAFSYPNDMLTWKWPNLINVFSLKLGFEYFSFQSTVFDKCKIVGDNHSFYNHYYQNKLLRQLSFFDWKKCNPELMIAYATEL